MRTGWSSGVGNVAWVPESDAPDRDRRDQGRVRPEPREGIGPWTRDGSRDYVTRGTEQRGIDAVVRASTSVGADRITAGPQGGAVLER